MSDATGWIYCLNRLPPEGVLVLAKIDDAEGCRNVRMLAMRGNL